MEESKSTTHYSAETNIEDTKNEITATLKREMSTMIETATKKVVDSVKNDLDKYMEGRFTSLEDKFITLVGTVETQLTSLIARIGNIGQNQQLTNMQQEQTQSQQLVTPEAIGIGTAPMYAHYPQPSVYQR
eukprot:7891159-Ditylum_brightwellii.AAC.1